ncbi:GNAT family N-acetyltransferase [Gordonia sp. (in: high G+C Gram-positive bacteria)]|uniref:GNAT family N-acetyltransferase n=1 Tax=Gordonia sp. (in: high G+C Gram-positive bacteria) TaxID=84139 RepID=UPI003F98C3DD
MFTMRDATADDCAAVADIYRHYVETSTASFDHDAPEVATWRERLSSCRSRGLPFLVVEDSDIAPGVLGFSRLGPYRGKSGWSFTAENSIYLRPEAAGRGIGARLLRATIDAIDPARIRHVMAVISEEAPGSIALHAKAGFVEAGRTPSVGYKFGRWVGVVYMHLDLGVPPHHR